ncbi:MAG TPA: formylglycine-generating enzyme family protein [Verrucomicrobiales bacterium]|nr:formylglycine-generating enzyme family protein [Verrucomicrobiales bacterium]
MEESGGQEKVRGVNGIEKETRQPRASRNRKALVATALVGTVLGILLFGGAWKWGAFGAKGKETAQERVFDLGNGVELTLCWCPPGTFLMGSPASEAGRRADEIQHEVTLTRGFWMAKTETTQGQWAALMPDNPSIFKGESLPVDSVSWDEAKAFAVALTERVRREGKLDAGWEFRLPGEAQWEYACRAGTATAYFTGDGDEALQRAEWHAGNSGGKTSRVEGWLHTLPLIAGWFKGKREGKTRAAGKKKENAFGLQDMHGNVWEWCEDGYGAYGAGSVVDPISPPDGPFRVLRGGSWSDVADWCRSACRSWHWPGFRIGAQGFRVCLVPGPAAEPLP